MKIPVKELIVIHVCYRDVFNAPVAVHELKKWLCIGNDNINIFEAALEELKREGLIFMKDNYLTTADNAELVDLQPGKDNLTTSLIEKGMWLLTLLGKIPFVRFIGISGSLAANNPTLGKSGINKGTVDMDIFMVTSRNTLWLFILLERLFTNARKVIKGTHFYCFNYVTDESFLEVYNKNFYTATEIVNVKPIVNKNIYHDFLENNDWFRAYYFGKKSNYFTKNENEVKGFISSVLWLPNFLSYVMFSVFRAIKRLDLKVIKEIKVTFDPVNKCNLMRISNPKGGYQELIKNRFEERLKTKFSDYYSSSMVQFLFPKESLFGYDDLNIYDNEHNTMFEKY